MILYKREQLIMLDMTIDEALKFIVSMGMISSDFKLAGSKNLAEDTQNKE